jgi:hypothetical protein
MRPTESDEIKGIVLYIDICSTQLFNERRLAI